MNKAQEHALWALREALRLCEAADVHVHLKESYHDWEIEITIGGGYGWGQLGAEDVDNLISRHHAEQSK